MIFDVGLLNLILYCVQQLGIALGLGAQTIMLVAYLGAIKDGVVDEREAQFLRATKRILFVSFIFIVGSGAVITALHALGGEGTTIVSPAYLFKWLLIVVVILLTALLHVLPETLTEGLLGGTWSVLFLVHILAPVTSWINLLTLWAVWLVGFMLVWYVLVYATHERSVKVKPPIKEKIVPKVVPKAPEVPQPPKELQAITLDRVPVAVEAKLPIAPRAPLQQIKTDPAPGSIATDTPFLPQVPPLQPIPTGPLAPVAAPNTPPVVPATPPEIKLGLNVMPKSPDQMQK